VLRFGQLEIQSLIAVTTSMVDASISVEMDDHHEEAVMNLVKQESKKDDSMHSFSLEWD